MKVVVTFWLFPAVSLVVGQQVCSSRDTEPEERDTRERCCRCVSEASDCNNDDAWQEVMFEGFECNEIDSVEFLSTACNLSAPAGPPSPLVVAVDNELFDLRATENGTQCPEGEKLCCNPVPAGVLAREVGAGDRVSLNFARDVCLRPALAAVQNFSLGITCGRRDSRVYYDHGAVKTGYTNPGEWPWVVPIYQALPDGSEQYIGAGAYVDSEIVITVAHNLKPFEDRPEELRVRLGDWNPNTRWTPDYQEGSLEEFPEIELRVECVRLHPDVDLEDSLANNIAVLRLGPGNSRNEKPKKTIAGVVTPRNAVDGLLNKLEATGRLERKTEGCTVPHLYLNTICLPRTEDQFQAHPEKCYVAAWGRDPAHRVGQRDVAMPLVAQQECEQRLRPEFAKRGVSDWRLKPSELCAGGEKGVDTCEGEGGAPLVCYDQKLDQFFAVGLVNYGLGCNDSIPAIYVNLADPLIQSFVFSAYNNEDFCVAK